MADLVSHVWAGYANEYVYEVHPLPYEAEKEAKGNYIFCKLVSDEWVPIYIGEGIICKGIKEKKHLTCVTKKGATHVHIHVHEVDVKDVREFEKGDLLQKHSVAYKKGCNIRRRGMCRREN